MLAESYRNRDSKLMSGCAIMGILQEDGRRISGDTIISSISVMRERSNGLGGGFAAYGIYPEFKDLYAFHLMYDNESARATTEGFLKRYFTIAHHEPIPTRKNQFIEKPPLLYRYFLSLKEPTGSTETKQTEEDMVVALVMRINRDLKGAFISSSGKNMGVFKGVGYPEDVGDFFRVDEYQGYLWTAHGRFPTNSPGWWGGAHPFGILDWSVVHNGEISSYGINLRYLQNFGYYCMLQTDTEVIAYLFDLLVRKHQLPVEYACAALSPPFWEQMTNEKSAEELEILKALRITYGGAMLNGPFAVIVATDKFMLGLNDRIKLRPLTAARKGTTLYVASEEAGIKAICKDPELVWHPRGSQPVIGWLKTEEPVMVK